MATPHLSVLRPPLELTLYASIAVMHKAITMTSSPEGLLKRIQGDVGSQ
jgi:hypothetical protein